LRFYVIHGIITAAAVLLNGGSDGVAGASWAGEALATDAHPSDFVIDYVRAYQYRSLLG
jgi:hypothetical protein